MLLPRKCIFCSKDKYQKNSRTRESLSNCEELRADERIRKIASERNELLIVRIASNDFIAKEAVYHRTCYREYTRTYQKVINEHDYEFDAVQCKLIDLYNNPSVIKFTVLQNMMSNPPAKKNLKRRIETNLNGFHFAEYKNTLLIYPETLNIGDLAVENYRILEENNRLKILLCNYYQR